jgi:peptide/nickel transport system permease protein
MTLASRNLLSGSTPPFRGSCRQRAPSLRKGPRTRALCRKAAPSGRSDYVNVTEVPNVRVLPLGTDNFGRDVLTELVSATGVSLQDRICCRYRCHPHRPDARIAGRGISAAWWMTSSCSSPTSSPSSPVFVLLILISFSIGQDKRGAFTIAAVIGFTAWVWTARAVRAQVVSLRNRDHVNLSKLSGHSVVHIILTDILPYIASYVFMALILQISSGILAEAGLSILGTGAYALPKCPRWG